MPPLPGAKIDRLCFRSSIGAQGSDLDYTPSSPDIGRGTDIESPGPLRRQDLRIGVAGAMRAGPKRMSDDRPPPCRPDPRRSPARPVVRRIEQHFLLRPLWLRRPYVFRRPLECGPCHFPANRLGRPHGSPRCADPMGTGALMECGGPYAPRTASHGSPPPHMLERPDALLRNPCIFSILEDLGWEGGALERIHATSTTSGAMRTDSGHV